MDRQRRKRGRDERGAVAIVVALLATALFVVGALVVDLGLARDTKLQSQNAADASALAAANVLYPDDETCVIANTVPSDACLTDAVNQAMAYATANFGVDDTGWASCPAAPPGFLPVPGEPTCISFNELESPARVRAVMPTRLVETGMGAIAGVEEIAVSTDAGVGVDAALKVTCGLCFNGSISTTKFNASVSPGGIAVNGSVTMSGNGSLWSATDIGYTGTFDPNNKISETGTTTKIPAFPDPWADKVGVPPAIDVSSKAGEDPCSAAGGPGVYGSHQFKNSCTLVPGLYVVTGMWDWKNVTVTANNVTIFATCGDAAAPAACTGTAGGFLDTKNGDLVITAPTSGAREGLAVVYDRNNPAPLLLQGNGTGRVTGAIYAPASQWDYNGGSTLQVTGGPVILETMTGNGGTGVSVVNSADVEIVNLPGSIALDQ